MGEPQEQEQEQNEVIEHIDRENLEYFAQKLHDHMMDHISESQKYELIDDEEVDTLFKKCE